MPYTPPSQRSPAVSIAPSPMVSRSNSYVQPIEHPTPGVGFRTGPRPGLPRSSSSTSYLNRERRSPQVLRYQNPSPDLGSVHERDNGVSTNGLKNSHHSVNIRQSPPPVNDNIMPTGAVISPPDSTQNSSDDEENSRGRDRLLENWEELKSAASAIQQRREGSPNGGHDSGRPKLTLEVTLPSPQPLLNDNTTTTTTPPLSKEARQISHSRSATESYIDCSRASESPEGSSSDDDLEMARSNKPPMVRKKSGELVKPALRPAAAKRRPSSMPGTPTYNKAVHFDNQLEHVRTFLQVDRPAAVSAGSSPVDPYDSETEFPFGESETKKEAPFEWDIATPNFPSYSEERRWQPVHVERVFLSGDKKFLIGSVIVRNLAFHKSVAARFTLDYWKTTSEVAAEFSHDIRKDIDEGCDRFVFSINLTDQTNLESKTLFFCVRYNVNGEEFWDSNGSINFQVEFTKKNLPQKPRGHISGSKSMTALSSLPRSTKQRPVRLPTFDDFGDIDGPFSLGSPPTAVSLIGEKPLRFRQKSIAPGAGKQSKPNSQAFGNRYDFGASLSAAKNSSPTLSDLRPAFAPGTKPEGSPMMSEQQATSSQSTAEVSKIATLTEKPSLQSQSYNDLINKYCFFGSSAKSSPSLPRPGNGQLDGSEDDHSTNHDRSSPVLERPSSTRSSSTSSVMSSPLGPRAASPLGFPFPQAMQGSLFDPQTPTAILS